MLLHLHKLSRNTKTLDNLVSDSHVRRKILYAIGTKQQGVIVYYPLLGNIYAGENAREVRREAENYLRKKINIPEKDISGALFEREIIKMGDFVEKYPQRKRGRPSKKDYPTLPQENPESDTDSDEIIPARAPRIRTDENPEELRKFNERMAKEYDKPLRLKYPAKSALSPKRADSILPEDDQGADFYSRSRPYMFGQPQPYTSRTGGSDRRRGGHHNPKRRPGQQKTEEE